MPIVNRTGYPIEQIEEICRFVLAAAFDPVMAGNTLVISAAPNLGVTSGALPDPTAPISEIIQENRRLVEAHPGPIHTIGTASPEFVTDFTHAIEDQGTPLTDWRERLVHNLASWRSMYDQAASWRASLGPPRPQDFVRAQEWVTITLQRYQDAVGRGQFSWQR